jgi:hypothetical protein
MTPAAIIAAAWALERERYAIVGNDQLGSDWSLIAANIKDQQAIDRHVTLPTYEACQAHLDQLCAAATERALKAAGWGLIPPPHKHVWPEAGNEWCQSARDGECNWPHCPQIRDNEPAATGRSCQLKWWGDEDEL